MLRLVLPLFARSSRGGCRSSQTRGAPSCALDACGQFVSAYDLQGQAVAQAEYAKACKHILTCLLSVGRKQTTGGCPQRGCAVSLEPVF